ncbi:hypothetical protein FB451DRAFT_1025761 [Mycena latifolia]|nr:hypothetical protein FB451DRAFT_1025761 [Mycena latifolia]
MPVSFRVATHPARPIWFPHGSAGYTSREILAHACKDQNSTADEILQSSFLPTVGAGSAKLAGVIPSQNGFVTTVIDAYRMGHALVIRPDDVWLAILSQFNFYINARAELLRANFVAHEGKRELVVYAVGTRYTVDFGALALQMGDLINKNVVDPALRNWIVPAFTTTTDTDRTASAVLAMATLKQYFSYKIMMFGCGIPRVTLEGERADWLDILGRLEKLKEYGLESIAWYHLLHPVISCFISAFDAPASPQNVWFWDRVAHCESAGSGAEYISGWITAFCAFSKEGAWLGHCLDAEAHADGPAEMLSPEAFWATYVPGACADRGLILHGTPYHRICGVAPGYAEVDVKLNDNGQLFDCVMVAGLVGARTSSSGDTALSPGGADDTVQPLAGWWMFTKKAEEPEREDPTGVTAFKRTRRCDPDAQWFIDAGLS